jgi:hypothetical protein
MSDTARDWEAERQWLLKLPASPETDALQDKWEREARAAGWLPYNSVPVNWLRRQADISKTRLDNDER